VGRAERREKEEERVSEGLFETILRCRAGMREEALLKAANLRLLLSWLLGKK